jgi:hypothetical protein
MARTTYTVIITHSDEPEDAGISAEFKDVGNSDEDKKAIAFGLRTVADMVETGQEEKRFTLH